jgi:hypothetical protein
VADAVRREGRYRAESGPLGASFTDAMAQLVADVEAETLTPLERAHYESLRAPDYTPPARKRRVACRCGAWMIDDRELSAAIAAGRSTLMLTIS